MITDKQIRDLNDAAMAGGDYRLVHVCSTALAAHEAANDLGEPLTDYDGEPTTRSEARAECARVLADMVTVEEMPDDLRGSHRAAGNWGCWPHNGAERRLVTREEAEAIVSGDADGYAHIVE